MSVYTPQGAALSAISRALSVSSSWHGSLEVGAPVQAICVLWEVLSDVSRTTSLRPPEIARVHAFLHPPTPRAVLELDRNQFMSR